MFLFPFLVQSDPAVHLALDDTNKAISSAGYNPNTAHAIARTDQLRSLNVPFCINMMAGGRYRKMDTISFTSLSEKEHYRLERNEAEDTQYKEAISNNENWGIQLHQHDYFELMYVLDGNVEQHIENGCYYYEKGHACLMNRSTRHYEVFGKDYFVIYLCIAKEYLRSVVESVLEESGQTGLIYRFFLSNLEEQPQYRKDYMDFTPIGSGGKGPAQAEILLESMAQELLLKQPGYMSILRGHLVRLFACLQLSDCYEMTQISLDSAADSVLFGKITQLMENGTGRITRAALSEAFNYSGDYLNRVVKKYSGLNISEYDQIVRMKKAAERFALSSESVAGVLTSLGFENKTHFYKIFQRKYGMTPIEYRKHCKEEKV